MKKPYDYLIVGAGLFGSVFAHEAVKKGKKCLVVEKRSHVGGNVFTENIANINVHKYGAHIFHTSNREIWKYINQFADFNQYVNSPLAIYKNELYNLPFNMNTFNKMWGVRTPTEAKQKIEEQIQALAVDEPRNLEEQAISLVGIDVYEKLIKGYTEKQWGRSCSELPAFIIKRLPVRYTYDNNYFNDRYQGIPIDGYTKIIEKLLAGTEVRLNTNFFAVKNELLGCCTTIVFTGPIDAYYDYCYDALEYRSLKFESELLPIDNYQGNAVVNYTEKEIPYTRIIEHKHFEFGDQPVTYITKEYPCEWTSEKEAYYPVNDAKNQCLYHKYKALADKEENVIFGGRLAMYKYYDMDQIILSAFEMIEQEFN
ncbi:MAG: UDP-galactopyranose mutase [Firmicutes bacterium]|nr:UDP-galactopyranose mutase [Bacillota bacterium]